MRWRRARTSWPLIMIGTLAAVLIHPSPAHAQDPCSLLYTCSDGSGAVDGTLDQLDDPIDEAIDAVGDATGVDTTPVKDVKKKVDTTVDRILDEASGIGGGTEPEGGGVDEPGRNGTSGSRPAHDGQPNGPARLGSAGVPHAAPGASRKVALEPEPIAFGAFSPMGALLERHGQRTPLADGWAGAIPKIIRQLAFPLTLGLAVFMFLLIQSRIDNTDSKLVRAPQDTHYLTFQ
jgi:hypothetical protein